MVTSTIKTILIFLLPVLTVLLSSTIYISKVTPVYEVEGSAVIKRPHVKDKNWDDPKIKNRWVWIRDGLTLKESLLNDDFFLNNIFTLSEFKNRYTKWQTKTKQSDTNNSKLQFIKNFKKKIKVIYSGGDSNKYTISYKDNNPEFAKKIIISLFDSLENSSILFETDKEEILFKYVDRPHIPSSPIWPNKKLILLAAMLIGLAIGFLIQVSLWKLEKK